MSDFKNWKDGDKLTGVDYTYERNLVTDKVQGINEQAGFKDRDLFILSQTAPEDIYESSVWMDTSLSLLKYYPGLNVNELFGSATVSAEFALVENIVTETSTQVTLDADFLITAAAPVASTTSETLLVAEMQADLSKEVTDAETSTTATLVAQMQQNLSREVNTSTSNETSLVAQMQQNLSKEVTDADTSASVLVTGQMQQNLSKEVSDADTNSSSLVTAQAQMDLSEEVTDAETTTTATLTAQAQMDLSASINDAEINSTITITGFAQTNTTAAIEDANTNSQIAVTGAAQFDLTVSIVTQTISQPTITAAAEMNLSQSVTTTTSSTIALVGEASKNYETAILDATTSTVAVTASAFAQLNQSLEPSATTSSISMAAASVTLDQSESVTDSTQSSILVVATQQGGNGYLIQARTFGASAPITFNFDDMPEDVIYVPTGVLYTIRENTPSGTFVSFEAPLTVNDGGNTWNFDKIIFYSIGFQPPANTGSQTINNDEIYEFYYTLPSTAAWSIYSVGQPYDETFNVFSDNDTSNSAVLALVNAQYPPENYAIGSWKRVRVFNYDMELIATRYVERTA